MNPKTNKLLRRQLKRCNEQSSASLETHHSEFLEDVSNAYEQYEQDVDLLERSLFITSAELNERNELLKSQLLELTDTQDELQKYISVINATFDATGEMILVYDINGNIVVTNAMGKMFIQQNGLGHATHWTELLNLLRYPKQVKDIVHKLKSDIFRHLKDNLEFNNGNFYEFRSLPQLQGNDLIGRVWCFKDITREKQDAEIIAHQAYHDALTGLPNRALLLDRIEHAETIAKRNNTLLGIVFIDLDNFKRVNDTEGHEGGDQLLIEVVKRIKSRLRDQDTLARQGGDEFVILIESINSDQDVADLCTTILELLTPAFTINGRQHFVSPSIGVAMFPKDDSNADSLIQKADMAMYQAKQAGKNTYRFYDAQLEEVALKQVQVERELREAINNQLLTAYFQPKINLETGKIVGAELLMRWIKSDGEMVSPEVFIPVAETTGLISEIGLIAIRTAFEQLEAWNEEGIKDLHLAINLSIIEFQDENIITYLIERADKSSLGGDNIIIELTESIFMQDKDKISCTMELLKTRGYSFALDDFGKGYSSFSYLQTLPIQYLKIDKTFLRNVVVNKQSAAIARSIIDIGHNLELETIAEGIEDAETLEYVKNEKCKLAQGYYLYRPMTQSAFHYLLINPPIPFS